MNKLAWQILDAEEKVQADENFRASERTDGQVKIGTGNRIDRENDRPSQFFIVVEYELPGKYGSPDKTLGDRNLEDHQPRQEVHPFDMIDVKQSNRVGKKIDIRYL